MVLALPLTTLVAALLLPVSLAIPSPSWSVRGGGGNGGGGHPQHKEVAFVLVGDSTTNNATTVNGGGWGNGFCGSNAVDPPDPSSLAPNTFCENTAKNGATTGTFVANGYWAYAVDVVKSQVALGRRTLITIQFGHNDQKIAPPESMGQNLTWMVDELRAIGGEPILVTPLTRRSFRTNGTIADTLELWANQTKLIAQQKHTHLLDLWQTSITYCEALGPTLCHVLNRTPDDNTHLNQNGSIVFGRMVADLMKKSYGRDKLPIIPNPPLSYNISHGIPSYYPEDTTNTTTTT
ncbi:SGNH hydrolase [Flagelloscypha sp. PMI_526]|nr:SGNH hydrolase [Flagelloscypha sp. PMI_526]